MDGYLTVAEAAGRLGVDMATVRRRIERGEIPAERVNARLWLIPREIVERLAPGKRTPGPKPGRTRRAE